MLLEEKDKPNVLTIDVEDVEALKERLGPDLARKFALIQYASKFDNEGGFAAFFELMEETNLHSEGEKWVDNIYQAKREGRGLLQKCHRESGKTTVFSKWFLAFQIGHHPEKVHGVCRINDIKAEATTEAIANVIENDPVWKSVFPHIVPDKEKGWGASGYEVRDTTKSNEEWARIIAKRPVCQGTFVGRGWKSGSWIGDRFNGTFIVDDIHDEKNTASDRELAAVKTFHSKNLDYCIMDEALEIWNFTPWLPNDLYADLEATGEYIVSETPVMKPAEPEAEGASYWPPTPLHRDYPEAGIIPHSGKWWYLYWPEWWNFDRMTKKYRKTGMKDFALQMLLDLEAVKGINLKNEWLHKYPASDIGGSWPVYMGVDYASTADKLKNKDRDYYALAIERAIPGGGTVLIDGYKGHLSKGEALQKTQSYAAMYPTLQLIGVENIGKGEEFYNDLVLLDDIYGKPLPLIEISHGRKSKGERFENWLGPRFQTARVWVTDTPTPFIRDFEDEWLSWPSGDHDDCLDAVYMCTVAAEGALPSMDSSREKRNPAARKENKNPFAHIDEA